MPDNLDKYLPNFDEAGIRARLVGATREELIEMLIRSYKQARIFAKMADDLEARFERIHIVPRRMDE